MAQNIDQIYTLNPSTTVSADDLVYLGLSPYGAADDSAIKWSDLVTSIIAEGAGGSTTEIQYNNAGALAGDSGFTTDGAGALSAVSLTLTSALPVTSGGTGLSSTTANQLLYNSASNTIAGLSTANNGLLVTSATGVPSIGSALTAGFTFGDPTSANQVVTINGLSSGVNPLTASQVSGALMLQNLDSTSSNFTSIQNVDSNDSLNAQISFINVDHTTNQSSINLYTRASGGSLALGATLDSTKDFTVVGDVNTTGINFGQDTLNYYDAGTWTPTMTFDTPGDLGVTYQKQTASYTRVGNVVTVTFDFRFTPTYTTASSYLEIIGAPFTPNDDTYSGAIYYSSSAFSWGTATSITLGITLSSFIRVGLGESSTTSSTMSTSNVPSGSGYLIMGSLTYKV